MKIPKETHEISPQVHWTGVKDWNRRMFDRLIPLPEGTSYNSYIIEGKNKTALIDSVNPGFEQEFKQKIKKITNIENIDYIIMNHAEPDHANTIKEINKISDAQIITTEKGKELAQQIHHIDKNKITTVEDQEKLDLGEKTLKFIDAPWLHWPETMLTLYEEEGILFSCDFFGSHMARSELYAEDVGKEEVLKYAKSYFGEIMMPYRFKAKQAMEKLEQENINMIAPSHGPIHRNPEDIIELHKKWSNGKVKKKVLIPYISMWGSTEKMVDALVHTIASEEVNVTPFNLATSELGGLARELVDSAGIIIGTPTVLGGSHPQVQHVTYLASRLNPPAKYLGVVESHGWGGGAVNQISNMVDRLDGEIAGAVDITGAPNDENIEEVVEFGKEFAEKIKSIDMN